MFKFTINDFDEMHSLVLDLGILIYLQQLVEFDLSGSPIINEHGNDEARDTAYSYLLDCQFQKIVELKKLFDKEYY